MRFLVSRTSDRELAPCDGAVKGTLIHWDRRTFASPQEHDLKLGHFQGRWADKGTEHGYWERGGGERGIQRNMGPVTAWFIKISTLEDLVAFRREHGDLVLTVSGHDGETPEIEIYDDYRE